jgi:hypothetical protein
MGQMSAFADEASDSLAGFFISDDPNFVLDPMAFAAFLSTETGDAADKGIEQQMVGDIDPTTLDSQFINAANDATDGIVGNLPDEFKAPEGVFVPPTDALPENVDPTAPVDPKEPIDPTTPVDPKEPVIDPKEPEPITPTPPVGGDDDTPTPPPAPLTLINSHTFISAAGTTTLTAITGVATFDIAPGNYTHTIVDFEAGDKLNFFHDAILNVVPDSSDADLTQSLTATDPNSGAVATITLNSLTAEQDVGLFNVPSFATVFGANTITQTFNASSTATDGVDTFNIAAGIPQLTIAGFKPNDKLVFFAGAVLNLVPDTATDDTTLVINASDAASGMTTVITLTGIDVTIDNSVFNIPSFSLASTFGVGAIA